MASGVVWYTEINGFMTEILGVDGTYGLLYCWRSNPAQFALWGLPIQFHDWSGYPSSTEIAYAIAQATAAINAL